MLSELNIITIFPEIIEEWKKYSQAIHSPQTTNMYLAKLKLLLSLWKEKSPITQLKQPSFMTV